MHSRELSIHPSIFLDRYLPGPIPLGHPTTTTLQGDGAIHDLVSAHFSARELDTERLQLDSIVENSFCPGHHFVEATVGSRFLLRAKSAVGTYYLLKNNAPSDIDALTGSSIELSVLIYVNHPPSDPFRDGDDGRRDNIPSDEKHPIREEIVSYARTFIIQESRLFHYLLIFVNNTARVVRVDRTHVVTTTKIAPMAICAFLWKFVHASPDTRGQDTTVAVIEHDSDLGRTMQSRAATFSLNESEEYERRLFESSLDPEATWLQVKVYEEHALQHRIFLVGKAVAGGNDLLRRGYIALDASNLSGPFVFLHDIWRAGLEQEGILLKILNENAVPHVPTLLYHGDVPDQTTESQELQHYRLVVKEVAVPLDEFENGNQLVHAIWCCLKGMLSYRSHPEVFSDPPHQAHEQAMNLGVLHRDIHPGNILLHKTSNGECVGLLNGWTGADVNTWSMVRKPQNKVWWAVSSSLIASDHLLYQSAWMFASVRSLVDETKAINLPDVLESFFNVLLYMSVRFLPTNFDNRQEAAMFLHDYFEGYTAHARGYRCGQAKRFTVTNGEISLIPYMPFLHNPVLRFLRPSGTPRLLDGSIERYYTIDEARNLHTHPIDAIVTTFLSWLQTLPNYFDDSQQGTRLQTHESIERMIKSQLVTKIWPAMDKGMDVALEAGAHTDQL